jgi:hypothetical protein
MLSVVLPGQAWIPQRSSLLPYVIATGKEAAGGRVPRGRQRHR